jgi:hypothetical protein
MHLAVRHTVAAWMTAKPWSFPQPAGARSSRISSLLIQLGNIIWQNPLNSVAEKMAAGPRQRPEKPDKIR